MKIRLMIMLLSILSYSGFSQVCGFVPTQADIDRLLINKTNVQHSGEIENREVVDIPITFHIVSDNTGNGGISENKIIDQMCALNEDYSETDFRFYIKNNSFNYVNHKDLYETPGSAAGNSQMAIEKAINGKNSVNIFICKTASTGGSSLGTTLGYYSPGLDVIVMRMDQINSSSGTLSHEMGHFFSLMHTFNGWDAEAYDANDHGNPINSQFSPGGVKNELQNGSNCDDAGDFLCDTNVDYNFGFGWNGCNTFTDQIKDFNGDIIDVEEENFMGYFIGCSSYHFSDQQIDVMRADFDSRSELQNGNADFKTIDEEVFVQFPLDDEDLPYYNDINLEWADVENASKYFIEVKQANTTETYISDISYLALGDLTPNRVYRWKVYPYNETGGCSDFSSQSTFSTGDLVGINALDEYELNLYPTIVDASNPVLKLESSDDLQSKLSLYSISGQLINIPDNKINSGINAIELPDNLNSGVYFLDIRIDQGSKKFKFIVR